MQPFLKLQETKILPISLSVEDIELAYYPHPLFVLNPSTEMLNSIV